MDVLGAMWDDATADFVGEQRMFRLSAAKVDAAGFWPFLAGAGDPVDFEHRLHLVAADLEAAVPADLFDEVVASLREDYRTTRTAADQHEHFWTTKSGDSQGNIHEKCMDCDAERTRGRSDWRTAAETWHGGSPRNSDFGRDLTRQLDPDDPSDARRIRNNQAGVRDHMSSPGEVIHHESGRIKDWLNGSTDDILHGPHESTDPADDSDRPFQSDRFKNSPNPYQGPAGWGHTGSWRDEDENDERSLKRRSEDPDDDAEDDHDEGFYERLRQKGSRDDWAAPDMWAGMGQRVAGHQQRLGSSGELDPIEQFGEPSQQEINQQHLDRWMEKGRNGENQGPGSINGVPAGNVRSLDSHRERRSSLTYFHAGLGRWVAVSEQDPGHPSYPDPTPEMGPNTGESGYPNYAPDPPNRTLDQFDHASPAPWGDYTPWVESPMNAATGRPTAARTAAGGPAEMGYWHDGSENPGYFDQGSEGLTGDGVDGAPPPIQGNPDADGVASGGPDGTTSAEPIIPRSDWYQNMTQSQTTQSGMGPAQGSRHPFVSSSDDLYDFGSSPEDHMEHKRTMGPGAPGNQSGRNPFGEPIYAPPKNHPAKPDQHGNFSTNPSYRPPRSDQDDPALQQFMRTNPGAKNVADYEDGAKRYPWDRVNDFRDESLNVHDDKPLESHEMPSSPDRYPYGHAQDYGSYVDHFRPGDFAINHFDRTSSFFDPHDASVRVLGEGMDDTGISQTPSMGPQAVPETGSNTPQQGGGSGQGGTSNPLDPNHFAARRRVAQGDAAPSGGGGGGTMPPPPQTQPGGPGAQAKPPLGQEIPGAGGKNSQVPQSTKPRQTPGGGAAGGAPNTPMPGAGAGGMPGLPGGAGGAAAQPGIPRSGRWVYAEEINRAVPTPDNPSGLGDEFMGDTYDEQMRQRPRQDPGARRPNTPQNPGARGPIPTTESGPGIPGGDDEDRREASRIAAQVARRVLEGAR